MPDSIEEELKDREKLGDINREADNLDLQAGGDVSSTVLGDIIARLKGLQAQAERLPQSGRVPENISAIEDRTAKKQAEKREEEIRKAAEMMAAVTSLGGTMMAASAAEIAFSQTMFSYMTENEQRFFDSLGGAQRLVMLDANGQVIRNADGMARVETMDGSVLQTDVARIKRYTLDKETQNQIELPPAGGGGNLEKLHDSLTRLEGWQIQHDMTENHLSVEDAREKHHNVFSQAHDHANRTFAFNAAAQTLKEAAKKNPILGMNAAITEAASELYDNTEKTVMTNVMHDLVPESGEPPREKSHAYVHSYAQGVDVSEPSAPLPTSGGHTNSSNRSRQ